MPILTAIPETHILLLPHDNWTCERCQEFMEGDAYAYFIEYLRPDSSRVTVRDAQMVLCRKCAIDLGDEDKLPA